MKLGIYRIPTKDCAELFKQLARGMTRSAPSKRRALNKKKKKNLYYTNMNSMIEL